MSWDISILKFSRRYSTVQEIPDDEQVSDLGPRSSVHAAVSAVFPQTDWTNPAWGVWEGPAGSIEFNVGSDPATSMMLHVRAGRDVVSGIVRLCLDNGWQGIDCASSEFIEQAADPARGLDAWARYRDQIIGDKKE